MQSDWYNSDGSIMQNYIMLFCGSDINDYGPCYPGGDAGQRWFGSEDAVPAGRWVRLELFANESSVVGARDGTLQYYIHRQDSPVSTIINWSKSIITRNTGVPDRWRYVEFQNYWGNPGGSADIYIDDVYVEVGSSARIELGDTATWARPTGTARYRSQYHGRPAA